MPRPITRLKRINPKYGDLVINVTKSSDAGRPIVLITQFEAFFSDYSSFRSIGKQAIIIHQRQPNKPFSVPDIRVTKTRALGAITEGSFYLSKRGDTKTLYRVLEANGFALEAEVLVQYNPFRVEPS